MSYKIYSVRVYEGGTKEWYFNGQLHREDGPAVERADGDKEWCLHGQLHREDGPAVERANGNKAWYLRGLRHRADGPAVERANGTKSWYLDGQEVSEEQFKEQVATCDGSVVEIDGKKYRLQSI